MWDGIRDAWQKHVFVREMREVEEQVKNMGTLLERVRGKGRITQAEAEVVASLTTNILEYLKTTMQKHDVNIPNGRKEISSLMEDYTEKMLAHLRSSDAKVVLSEPVINFFHAWCAGLLMRKLFDFGGPGKYSRVFYSSPTSPILDNQVD